MRTDVCFLRRRGCLMTSIPRSDRAEIERSLRLLVEEGAVTELRVLQSRRGTVSGYYTDLRLLARDACAWSGRAPGVYFTPNPVDATLLARACNHFAVYARHTTGDPDITARRWFLIGLRPGAP